MPESTRIAKINTNSTQIHIKKNEEVTTTLANQSNLLPTTDDWVVAELDVGTGNWSDIDTFNTFVDADNEFINRLSNRGFTTVERLKLGKQNRVLNL